MTSSMLSGERRWASSRRGGMTVLGKVAVPKPINLPSQRLENHGEDPNVEIVPKGTLGWGSKPSSSASNAWGSSSVSPNANGGASSPSHLSARPSSGGSGTRPSSSGSDRAPELTTNAWGSNSRPSSSSGALTSNQTLQTSLRPRSAETRPGSSQLTRFADHMTENSVAWNAARTTERLGISQHKNDGFSLSSGDFPTLGSEKDKSVQNIELQDHDSLIRPASSSGLGNKKHETSAVDGVPVHANSMGETENSWRRDYQAFNEDGMRPEIEKWQGNLPPYPNAGIPPQHFDPWRGGPVNNHQGDVWFRGPPNGPPFANPVAPGGFPIEPFPFYRPNIPPTGLANPPQVPPPRTGPIGQHKNGEAYRPHIPDAYIPPGMPLRPGFYPGPMTYEGYYGPPLAYCNSNERDVPFMGMAMGPAVYNRYPNHNPPEPGNSQVRSSGCGPAGKPLASELAESNHTPDTAGQYRVLLKQHNEWGRENEPTNREGSLTTNASYANMRDQPRVSVQESDHIRNAEIDLSVHGKEASPQTSGKQGSSSVNNAKPLESTGSLIKFDNISEREMDGVSSNTVQIPSRPSAPKDSTLIQKIEGLNAKARDNPFTKGKEEQRNKFHSGNRMENEVSADVVFPKTTPATEVKNPTPHGISSFGGENDFESPSFSGTATSRQVSHGMQDRSNNRKGRLNTQDTDGWRKKSGVIDSSSAQLEVSNILVGEHKISVDAYERSGSYSQVRRDGESIQTVSDLADSHAQRAKISKVKESAKQRIKPLQEEEEEEQAKKQKAKTTAKLDESNRHALAMEGSMQRKYAGNSSLQNKQEAFKSSESERALGKSGAPNSSVMPTDIGMISDTNINRVGKPPILSSETPSETLKSTVKGPVLNRNPSETLYQDVNCADAANALHQNNVASKQKRTGYKQKQNISSAKTSNVSTTSAAPKVEDDTMACVNISSDSATIEVGSANGSGLPMNPSSLVESSVNQKKKNNRNSKNKQKTEETSPLAALPSAIPKEANLSRSSVGNKPHEDIEFGQGSLQSRSLSIDSYQHSAQRYLENEESYGRTNSQLKSQHSRRMPRNMQANRQAEKSRASDVLMWAPVKPQDKTEIPEESSERTKTEVVIPAKCDQQVHNLKSKRAEMERYIPKPVAKEMAQQGSLQQMVSSTSQAPTDDSVERFGSGSQGPQITRHTNLADEKAGSGMESKNRDSRQTRSRQGKAHGSWRQRNPTESTDVRDMDDGGNPGSNSQAQMSETSFLKRQTKHANDISKPDGSNNPDNHDSAVQVSVSGIKDHKAINMERQVPFRRQKGTRNNHDVDQKKNAGDMGKTETLLSSTEHNQPDADAVFKENPSIGECVASHWQPKFQASNNHRGSKPNTKDSPRHVGASFPEGYDKDSNALMAQPSEKSRDGETPNIGNPEAKRERRNAPSKGHPHSRSQVAVGSSEEAPTGMDPRHQQRQSSRKNGNQNRFGKGHESPGDWIIPAQDDGRHHNRPTNQNRQGPDRHYHPVGAHGDSTSDNFERPKDGNYNAGGKFRERGQTHSRRGGGNFSGHY